MRESFYKLDTKMNLKKDIRALTKTELRDFFVENGDKAFRGNQVYEWLWSKSAHTFEDMTNISLETRQMLEDNFVIRIPQWISAYPCSRSGLFCHRSSGSRPAGFT